MRRRDRYALALLASVTPRRDQDALLGDLVEAHADGDGLALEAFHAVAPILAMRIHRAGGVRAVGFACFAGILGATAIQVAVFTLWQDTLFLVPLRADGPLPFSWQCAAFAPTLITGLLAGRLALRLAVHLLGGRA